MKYQVVLFDADGVLIKSARQFSDRLQADYGIRPEKLQPFFTGVFRECSRGKADLKDELAKVVGEWGWQGGVDELLTFWFTEGTQIDESVADFVRELRARGVRTYMTTDQERYRGEYLRDLLGHGVLFDDVFFSAAIGVAKKEPGFFAYVDNVIKTDRASVLFVDDDKKNVEAAKQFGYDSFWFKDLDELKTFCYD